MPKLFFYFHEIRRLRRLCSISSSPSSFLSRSLHSYQNPNPLLTNYNYTDKPQSHFISLRSFSIHSPTNSTSENDEGIIYDVKSPPPTTTTTTTAELLDLGFNSGDGGSEVVAPGVGSGDEWVDHLVSTVTSVLDGYHDLTGLPWWIIIVSSTLALRMALLPLLIYQLKKMKTFSELYPKLPPPFPPLLSGKSYIKQYLLFRKAKLAVGCPSALWGLATISVQIPCFLLWMTSIRRMSLDHHPGFDCGGILWFQNLTETPHGVLSPIFPILIGGLHFINVQISFKMARAGKVTGLLGILARYYKIYLNMLTVPLCLIGFAIPQGSLVYWVTNSSVTLVQNLCLTHPAIREELGLPDINTKKIEETANSDAPEIRLPGTEVKRGINALNLSPDELVPLSVKYLASGKKERAIQLLRLALKKDPEYIRALVLLGQTLREQGMPTEATELLERAISKLLHGGCPTKEEDVDFLILASMWAGIMSVEQGNKLAGLEHLQRIAQMAEPEDRVSKAHYFDGLFVLSSLLFAEGQKDKAEMYLRKAVAYDYNTYNEYLQQCLEESNPNKDKKD